MKTKVGRFEVYTIVGGEREGTTSIIPDAEEALIKKLIPASGFMHSTNVYLVKTPDHNILIDTGFGGILFDKLKELGVEPPQIDAVLLTHLHGDHFGGLQSDGKALFPNAKVYLDEREHNYFTKTAVDPDVAAAFAPYEVITFDAAPLGSAPGELFPGISAIANYGHTPGHTAFLAEDNAQPFMGRFGQPQIPQNFQGKQQFFIIHGDGKAVFALVDLFRRNATLQKDAQKLVGRAFRKVLVNFRAAGGQTEAQQKNKRKTSNLHDINPKSSSTMPLNKGSLYLFASCSKGTASSLRPARTRHMAKCTPARRKSGLSRIRPRKIFSAASNSLTM